MMNHTIKISTLLAEECIKVPKVCGVFFLVEKCGSVSRWILSEAQFISLSLCGYYKMAHVRQFKKTS